MFPVDVYILYIQTNRKHYRTDLLIRCHFISYFRRIKYKYKQLARSVYIGALSASCRAYYIPAKQVDQQI